MNTLKISTKQFIVALVAVVVVGIGIAPAETLADVGRLSAFDSVQFNRVVDLGRIS